MLIEKTLYTLNDITIIPSVLTKIVHRSECSVLKNGTLPLITAPMYSVVSKNNYNIFKQHNIIPIIPRTECYDDRISLLKSGEWVAFGLDEFKSFFCTPTFDTTIHYKVLIDIANGHLEDLIQSIKEAKAIYNIDIMCGNIANPETFFMLASAGVWGVRCTIGTGNCCITASNTAIYYPTASLIDECYKLKQKYHLNTNIICDGGIRNYSDIIKALALGADYCMCGSLFSTFYESASEIYNFNLPASSYLKEINLDELNDLRFIDNESLKKEYIKKYYPLKKTIFGMSTRKAQCLIAQSKQNVPDQIKTKTSEGVEKEVVIQYTINQWVNNFIDYLRSTMSYCNKITLDDFIGNVTVMLLSPQAKLAINN